MQLGDLIRGARLAPEHAAIEITGLTADSRRVEPGFLFAALPGSQVDGFRFVPAAIEAGAAAILAPAGAERSWDDGPVLVPVADARRELALAAARFYPKQPETIVAVTGTAGKTSVAVFARQIFEHAGHRSASIGTIGIVTSDGKNYGGLTTPDPVTLHRDLDRLAGDGISHAALEASSHGLDQHRLDGVRLSAAGFTNLGRDHLDYHPDVESYLQAKLRLFRVLLPDGRAAVIDADEAVAARVAEEVGARGNPLISFGRAGADLKLLDAGREGFSQILDLDWRGSRVKVRLPLAGAFQARNAMMAACLAIAAGIEWRQAFAALDTLQGVPGRLELVARTKEGALVFVDYAHKPEALENVLTVLKPYATGRLVTVVGAGGDRDPGKRPIMGEIAGRLSDLVIVTDDNPRGEDPASIRAAILAACSGAREIGDRSQAIREAVGLLGPGDVLCIAGKGHETGQIVGGVVHPFSDHEEIAKAVGEDAA